MDFIAMMKDNVGAMLVGALWAIYTLADKVWRDHADRRRMTNNDNTSVSLVDQLTVALKNATELASSERNRADGLAKEVNQLSIRIGSLEAKLERAEHDRDRVMAEVETSRQGYTDLVLEIRNREKTIKELVALNRQILGSMGCPIDAAAPYEMPGDGTEKE